MADDNDTPKTEVKPAAARRRAPRKDAKPAAKSAPKPGTAKSSSAKPRAAASAAKPATAPAPAAPKRATTPKPRAAARAKPAPKRSAPPKPAEHAEKGSGKWGTAAVVGGLAAVGAAATAALLSLRGSTPKFDARQRPASPQELTGGAHSPDGEDASASFKAGIADENSIPD